MKKIYCNLCGSDNLKTSIDFGNRPASKSKYKNCNTKLLTPHSIKLLYCADCSLMQLDDPIVDADLYENYITLSNWKSQPQLNIQIEYLINNNLINKSSKVLEIGSNDGNFLLELKKCGVENTIGIEPARDAYISSINNQIRTINEFFNYDLAQSLKKEFADGFDLIVSRQSLEHITDLRETAKAIKYLLKQNGLLLIEVPDMSMSLTNRDYTIWDEHTNYFTLDTLKLFLQLCGCVLVHHNRQNFSGTCIYVIGRATNQEYSISYNFLETTLPIIEKYSNEWPYFKRNFHTYIKKLKVENRIALYGLSARAFSILDYVGIDFKDIDSFIDDNLEKNKALNFDCENSDSLHEKNIDVCILGVSGEHEDKILAKHHKFIEKGGRFISILPPSKLLPDFWTSQIE
ncbi:MAG: methyltransferase domain-containing protein [Polynucleobacter sp.]|nr:methyltransferase domain-containing protein [Polynucleobacter sp.]